MRIETQCPECGAPAHVDKGGMITRYSYHPSEMVDEAPGRQPSQTLERAYRLLLEAREARGLATYGETLDTSKVNIREYLAEEMADALMYSARIIRDLEEQVAHLERVVDSIPGGLS